MFSPKGAGVAEHTEPSPVFSGQRGVCRFDPAPPRHKNRGKDGDFPMLYSWKVRLLEMKRLYVLIACILCVIFLSSCVGKAGVDIEKVGMDCFDISDGYVELNVFILPSEDFLTRFQPVAADYHFAVIYEHTYTLVGEELSIITARYDPSTYEEAKAYCLNNMMLQEIEVPDHNGYHFIENIEAATREHESLKTDKVLSFPYCFNLLAYNDTESSLAFIGCYEPSLTSKESDREKVVNNWVAFLAERFPEICR